jgi:hypothetical protein
MNVRVFLMIPVATLVVACERNIVAPAENPAWMELEASSR